MTRIDALDELRNEVIATIDGRKDYLEALVVAKPTDTPDEVWKRQVETMLFDMHLDGIDVAVDGPSGSGPWILEKHLGPAWA